MSILGRLSTLIKSNVNDLIDSMQDPAKEIDQMILDMEESARQARSEVAKAMSDEKRMAKRVEALAGEVKTWEENAMKAVQAGDDALAREALKRKAEKEAERVESDKAMLEQKGYVDQLNAGLKALDARVKDVKLRQNTLREKARANKGKSSLSGKTAAFDDFERMSGKIEAVEAEAGLHDELAGQTAERVAADRKFKALTEDKSLDDALAEPKKKLGG